MKINLIKNLINNRNEIEAIINNLIRYYNIEIPLLKNYDIMRELSILTKGKIENLKSELLIGYQIIIEEDNIKTDEKLDEMVKYYERDSSNISIILKKFKKNQMFSQNNFNSDTYSDFDYLCRLTNNSKYSTLLQLHIDNIKLLYKEELIKTETDKHKKGKLYDIKILEDLERKIKESKDLNKRKEYTEEYKIKYYMNNSRFYYNYSNVRVSLINVFINNEKLCRKAFKEILEDVEECKEFYLSNWEQDIKDINELIRITEEIATKVKHIKCQKEREDELYRSYFGVKYIAKNKESYLTPILILNDFSEENTKKRTDCLKKLVMDIKKYKCEDKVHEIFEEIKLDIEENSGLYKSLNSLESSNLIAKCIEDQKYLCDYCEDEIQLSNFQENDFDCSKSITMNKRYFVLEALKDAKRIRSLFSRHVNAYTEIYSKALAYKKIEERESSKYLQSLKNSVIKSRELEKEIFDIVEKVKDIENKPEQESMINILLITEEELKESFNNIFEFENFWREDIDYIDWNIGRFINLGFYYKNGKKEILDKIFNEEYKSIENSIRCETFNKEIIYLIRKKVQLNKIIKEIKKQETFTRYCYVDKTIELLFRSLQINAKYGYCSPNSMMIINPNDYISYHRGTMLSELILIIKKYGLEEFKRVTTNMLNSIGKMEQIYYNLMNNNYVFYSSKEEGRETYIIYKAIVNAISDNSIKIFNTIESSTNNKMEFRSKLNDLISCLELIYQFKCNRFISIPIASIQINTIINKLKDIIDRNSEEIFNLAADTITITDTIISESDSEINKLDNVVLIEDIKERLTKQQDYI